MSGRNLAVIFGLFILLFVAWLTLGGRGLSSDDSGDELVFSDRVGPDISRMSVFHPAESSVVRLLREDAGWTVNGYPANDSLANALLGALADAPPARVVARSAANHVRLGVADSLALLVELGPPDDPEFRFLLGGSGPEGRFIRLPGSAEVYVVEGGAFESLDRNEFRWRNSVIVAADTTALSRIVLTRGNSEPLDIRRQADEGWQIGAQPVDTAYVREFLEKVVRLEANGFPADSFVFAVDFDTPDAVLELHAGSGPTDPPPVSLLFASLPDRPEVLVRRADDPIVYAIDPGWANFLTAGRSRWLGVR